MKKNILGLIVLLSVVMVNCNAVKKEKKEDRTLLNLLIFSFAGTGGSCGITVLKNGRETSSAANPVVLSTTDQYVAYSKVIIVPHSIGVVTFKNATVNDSVVFNTVDVADFDGSQSASLPLVYTTADCPVTSDKLITSNASTYYTRSESGSSYTYKINQAGDYSFVLYQLQYPPVASTVKKN